MIAFGPVPSRRLGQSMGINNIPPKICSYSCIYCQLGRAKKMQIKREEFYKTDIILKNVEKKICGAETNNEKIDYVCFVPDGEHTLDINLGKEIESLKNTGIKTAVISNSSLIDNKDVQSELLEADWVSLKVDAVSNDYWHKINRPHKSLDLGRIQKGMLEFSGKFRGKLVTETMLVNGINDDPEELHRIADFIETLRPEISYISIPIRPPAEEKIKPASEISLNEAFQIFSKKIKNVEPVSYTHLRAHET